MKRLTDWFHGYCRVIISGATPSWCLNRMNEEGIVFWGTAFSDAFTVELCIYPRDLEALRRAAEKSCCRVEQVERIGFSARYGGLRKRFALLSLLLAVGLGVLVPKFVWFYEVEGNEKISAEQILRLLPEAGVKIGTYGPNIVPQNVKNKMLLLIPELSWLTVVQNGGCAKVIVRERTPKGDVVQRKQPMDLVAVRDGLITEISALDGAPAVQVGDVVTKGQTLISGYMDLEYKIRTCTAAGEVYARTWRDLQVVTPQTVLQKAGTGKTHHALFVTVGRKRIKIFGNASNFLCGCDKITEDIPLSFSGGHQLPVSLVWETVTERDLQPADTPNTEDSLRETLRRYVKSDMLAGEILREHWQSGTNGETAAVHGVLECREMIARQKIAEFTEENQYDNGTSHQRRTN